MKQCTFNHVYFKPHDFTIEEMARKNKLAMAVLAGRRRICKNCGFESKYKRSRSELTKLGCPKNLF